MGMFFLIGWSESSLVWLTACTTPSTFIRSLPGEGSFAVAWICFLRYNKESSHTFQDG
jgi:hypothetical protein